MKTSFLRSAAVAFLIAGAGAATTAIVVYPQAAEAAVRASVGGPLKEAISLASSGHGSEALAKVHQAESVGGLTPSEQQSISQTKEYIAAKTGQGGGAAGCKAKFANDYNASRYRDAISDADCLRKGGGLSGQDELIIAQAHYMLGEYAETIRELDGLGSSQQVLELKLSAAFKSGDAQTMRSTLEQLIRSGKTQYWSNLLTTAENTKGLKDHQTLDIYRLRYLTGTMRGAGDYTLAAELALQVGSPQEAANIVQKGIDAKVLTGDRTTRLLALAKTQATKDSGSLAALQAAADKAPNGDADVKMGEELWGFGKGADAVTAVQNGISKGVSDKTNAQMRLGQAYIGAGQHDAAANAFAKIPKDDVNGVIIGHLWSLYANTSH